MRIIPVLDLLNSVVVRGVAGQRDEYRSVESCFAESANAVDMALAIRRTFGLNQLYVADLDAILDREPNWPVYQQLLELEFELLIDAGVSTAADVAGVLAAGAKQVIVGLETWPLLSSLEMLLATAGEENIIFSLDMKDGRPVSKFRDMTNDDPADIGACVLEAGVREMIVLDLGSVGMKSGLPTLELCRELNDFAPNSRLITGGGVRNPDDLKQLADEPIDGILVASALHDGSITAEDIA
jgi:phosphoribosylformimino-5-aminoimidazole carboxamide ribotide isomerase